MYSLRCNDLGPEWDCVQDFVARSPTKEEVKASMLAHCGKVHPEEFVNLTVEKLTAKIENMFAKTVSE